MLIVPANHQVERQPVIHLPIVLDVDAELEIIRFDRRIALTGRRAEFDAIGDGVVEGATVRIEIGVRSEEHTSELQSLMRISYAVFCLKKKQNNNKNDNGIES